MPRFSANLSFLFTERPLPERIAAAARAGFKGVEYMSPYEHPPEVLRAALQAHGVEQVLFNLPMGDYDGGERGLACLPGREADFRAGVARAIDYAQALGCTRINATAGVRPPEVAPEHAWQTMVDNLRYAAAELQRVGVRLLTEPINHHDVPGYFINRTAEAAALIEAVGSDNLYIQYDLYHAQRMEGELAATIAAHLPRIAHMQLADNPGRHEPGSGEIRFEWLLPHIDALGYTGWIGCEYKPRGRTEESLGWMAAYR